EAAKQGKQNSRYVPHQAYIPALGRNFRIHLTNASGAAIVDSRPCRISAQSSNWWDCLISVSVTGGSMRPVKEKSTTVSLGSFGSGRAFEVTSANPTTWEPPPL